MRDFYPIEYIPQGVRLTAYSGDATDLSAQVLHSFLEAVTGRPSGLADPFRRLGADRTASDNGVGLGLSIVAAIASAHLGTLDLRARAEGGLSATIELPRARRSSDDGDLR